MILAVHFVFISAAGNDSNGTISVDTKDDSRAKVEEQHDCFLTINLKIDQKAYYPSVYFSDLIENFNIIFLECQPFVLFHVKCDIENSLGVFMFNDK